ncbi:MAG TPA: rhodanese-like domain-containing protein [Gemmatimonadaceae bacterium]|jgi:hydroxyacylglutathione hydrolase
MLLERLFDEGLAQATYLVGCEETKSAIIVDPGRDVQRFIDAAKHHRMRIEYVTETHIHADFVSGARELAAQTSAALLLSGEGDADWQYRYDARRVYGGDTINVGTVRIQVRHTPGHTPEHLAFLITDTLVSDQPLGLLSGDFIFVGDVGRPDLLERAAGHAGTMDALARRLFASLQATKHLPGHLQVWPGHGAGSACGKALGALPSTTIGYERLTNWAFQIDDEEQFIKSVLEDQPEPPKYFARMKTTNRDGPAPMPTAPLPELALAEVTAALKNDDPVIDVRSTADFARGHIPGTINLPTGTSFATWAGSLLKPGRPITILADEMTRVERARMLLAEIGLDHVAGFALRPVREQWAAENPLQTTPQMDVKSRSEVDGRVVIDVRGISEWRAGHLPGATHLFLGDLAETSAKLPRDTPIAVYCQGGTRSAIAASLLQAKGFTKVTNLQGGITAWKGAGLPVEQ